ncbi:MAG TPA: helix-turn-helix transcriptional regulator [Longimicrobium sp.]
MTTDERRCVGFRIRAARERQGWDRGELARRLGVHAGSVARWESGGAVPHAWTVQRIAELAGTTPEWLTSGGDAVPSAGDGVAGETAGVKADPFTLEAMAPFVAAIAPPGGERLRKLDVLEGLRRMLTARGALPGWWYQLHARVEEGAL